MSLLFFFSYSFITSTSTCIGDAQKIVASNITHYIYPLNKIDCPGHPKIACPEDFLQELKADAAKSIIPQNIFGVINLSNILRLFQHDNCHFVVNSFRGYDIIAPGHVPILLRKPTVGVLWRRQRLGKFRIPQMVWIYQEFIDVQRYVNHSSTVDKVSLSGSTFGVGISVKDTENVVTHRPDIFIRLNISHYSMRTKPWNCNIALYLTPNFTNVNNFGLNLPATFNYNSKMLSHANLLPSPIPPVHFIVVGETEEYDLKIILVNIFVSTSTSPSKGSTISHDIFFLIQLETTKQTYAQHNLIRVNHIMVCPRLINSVIELTVNMTNLGLTHLHPWKSMSSVICNNEVKNNMRVWSIQFEREVETVGTSALSQILLMCQDKISPKWVLNNPKSPVERKAHVIAHVWESIMGNYTYRSLFSHSKLCQNGKTVTGTLEEYADFINQVAVEVKFNIEGSGTFQYPFVAAGDPNNMRIISCGKRGLENFSLTNLFNVYDNFTWYLILCCVLIVSFTLHQSAYQEITLDVCHTFLCIIRSLLEQGDPFPLTFIKSKRHQLIIGTFLLVAIIISNAFKNTNVYNMITPRKVLPYENLQQLIKDKYQVFTRVGNIVFTQSKLGNYTRNLHNQIYDHVARWNTHPNTPISLVGIISEAKHIIDIMKIQSFEEHLARPYPMQRLMNLTRLHHSSVSKLTGVVQRYLRLFALTTHPEWHSVIETLTTVEMKEEEQVGLFEEIRKCQRSAVLLPLSICSDWQQKLQRLGHPHVFVGKERYFNSKVVFRLEGLLPRYAIKYIISVHESGIWKRWEDLLKGANVNAGDEIVKPEKPNMSGNIVMIFSLLAGNVFAAVVFIIELFIHCGVLLLREWSNTRRIN